MPSDAPYDLEYRRAMLVITHEQSAALNAHSKGVRLQAVDTIQRSRQLREQCAALSERIAAALRGHSRL